MARSARALLCLLFAALLAGPAVAQEACDFRIGSIQLPRLSDLRYDIFDTEPVRGTARIEVERRSEGDCPFVLTVTSEVTARGRLMRTSGGSLEYRVIDADASQREIANNTSPNTRTAPRATIPADRSSVTIEITVEIPGGQLTRSGIYQDALTFTVFDQVDRQLRDRETISLTVDVLRQLDVSVSAGETAFDLYSTYQVIDFGTLENGETQRAFVSVRSTEDFVITFSSDNDGRLVHERGEDAGAIEYTVTLDGRALGRLVEEVIAGDGRGPTGGTGRAFPVEFRIGEVARKRAGVYRDFVRVTVRPRE